MYSGTLPGTATSSTERPISVPSGSITRTFSESATVRRVTQSGESTWKMGLDARMPCVRAVASTVKACRSRSVSNPAIASTSPPVSRTAAIGDERATPRGTRQGVASICCRKSGDAFSKSQFAPSPETAIDACVRGRAAGSPDRARLHAAEPEFHCGNPPPAAAPRTTTCTASYPPRYAPGRRPGTTLSVGLALQVGTGVAVDFGAKGDFGDDRLVPCHDESSVFCFPSRISARWPRVVKKSRWRRIKMRTVLPPTETAALLFEPCWHLASSRCARLTDGRA